MKNQPTDRSLLAVIGQLGWAILVGLAITVVFYLVVLRGPLGSDLAVRYFASHPVSYCATAMFFIGLVALGAKLKQVVSQYGTLGRTTLGLESGEAIEVERVDSLLSQLAQLPAAARRSYLGVRLRRALEYLADRGTADGLDDELKYLADMDAAQQHESFALVRILIWATPMLGFLGTVIGITQALGDLDPTELATNVQSAMDKLLSGLYVAFDTTALALTLSIVLMFLQFLVDRLESELLTSVDSRTQEELAGRLSRETRSSDPYLASVERMSSAVIRAADLLVKQQITLWEESLNEMRSRWEDSSRATTETIADGLERALDASLTRFVEQLSEQQTRALQSQRESTTRWEAELASSREQFAEQSRTADRQLELLKQLLEATSDVKRLEAALNDNLQTLATAGSFEQAVMSLGATAQLLAAQMGQPAVTRVERVHGDRPEEGNQEKAA